MRYCLRLDYPSRRRPPRVFGKRPRQTSASDLDSAGFANPVTPLRTEKPRNETDQSVTFRPLDEAIIRTHPARVYG
jgi:hypothetical protein